MDVRVVACCPPLVFCQIFDLLEVHDDDDDDYDDTHIAANRELSSHQITICL